MWAWTAFIWLGTKTVGGLLWTEPWPHPFRSFPVYRWVAAMRSDTIISEPLTEPW